MLLHFACLILLLGGITSQKQCSSIETAARFDCMAGSQTACQARGCCWDVGELGDGSPTCFYPEGYGGYEYLNVSFIDNGMVAYLNRTFPSSYPKDVAVLRLDVQYYSDTTVRIKISDPQQKRYESPYPKIKSSQVPENAAYTVSIDESTSGFQVSRRDGEILFDAKDKGGFIYANQFLQLSASLAGSHFYGLSEHRANLALDTNWTVYTMFNHDVPPAPNTNLYGSHPFFLSSDLHGRSYGVFLHSSNAMDIVLQPLPAITYRSIGGILDFYIFLGPTPKDVVRQYTDLIGRSSLPPYWGLGFQLCRYVYGSTEGVRKVWQRNRDALIPFDVQWTDYDYMINHTDFTLDPNTYGDLPAFIQELHNVGMHYVPMLDPGFSGSETPGSYPPYDQAVDADILIKDKEGKIFQGLVWNDVSTVWPDFTNPKAHDYWINLLAEFHKVVPFDGLWIDMNEPSNFVNGSLTGCPGDELENPPYTPAVDGGFLSYMTICMSAKQAAGSHYDVHNIFGISEAEATNKALRNLGKRPFIISRSTFPGIGKYSGHWSGDNASTWYDLLKSIQELLSFNMLGVSFIGADICGFRENTTQEMCNRWSQLGAFYTFSRNHNDKNFEYDMFQPIPFQDQDPAVFNEATVASIRKALQARYTLLPYLYTLLYQAQVNGDVAARPLFFEFPDDPEAYKVDLAFLWGSGLLIVPVVEPGAITVDTYLPPGRWFDWYSGAERNSLGENVTLDAPYDTIPLLLRGGNVIPTHVPGVTTSQSRKNGFILIVVPDSQGRATGSLYWDDGEVIDPVENGFYGILNFSYAGNHLTSRVEMWDTPDVPTLIGVKVLGITSSPTAVSVNGLPATFNINQNKVLTIEGLNTTLNTPLIDVIWE